MYIVNDIYKTEKRKIFLKELQFDVLFIYLRKILKNIDCAQFTLTIQYFLCLNLGWLLLFIIRKAFVGPAGPTCKRTERIWLFCVIHSRHRQVVDNYHDLLKREYTATDRDVSMSSLQYTFKKSYNGLSYLKYSVK